MESSSFLNESASSLHPPETIMIQQDNPLAEPDSPLSTPPHSPAGTNNNNNISHESSTAGSPAALPCYTMVRQNNSELEGRTSRKSRLRAQARSLFDEQKEEDDDDDDDEEEDELVPRYQKTTLSPRPYAMAEDVPLDEQIAMGSGSYTPSVSFTSEGVEIGPMMIPGSPPRSLGPSLDENGSHAPKSSDNTSMAPSIDEAGSNSRKKSRAAAAAAAREDVRDVPTTHRSLESVRATPPEAATTAAVASTTPSQAGPLDEVIQDQQLGPDLPPPPEETGPRRIKPKSPMERLRHRARSTGRTRVAHLALDLNRRPKAAWNSRQQDKKSVVANEPSETTAAAAVTEQEEAPMLPSLGTTPLSPPNMNDKPVSSVPATPGADPSNAIDLTKMFAKSPNKSEVAQTAQRSSPPMEDPPSLSPKQSSSHRSSSKSPRQGKKRSTRVSSSSPTKRNSEGRSRITVPRKTRPMRSHKKSYPMDDTGLSSSDETPLMTNALYNRAKSPFRRQDRRTRQQTQLQSMYGKALKHKKTEPEDNSGNAVSPKSPVAGERSAVGEFGATKADSPDPPPVDPTALALPPLVVDQQQIQSIGVKALMSVCDGIGSLFLTQKPGEASRATKSPPKEGSSKAAEASRRASRSLSPSNGSRRRRRLMERAKSAHKAEADRLYPPTSPNNPLLTQQRPKREEFPMDEVSELGKDIVNALHLASSADVSEKSPPISVAEDALPTKVDTMMDKSSKNGPTASQTTDGELAELHKDSTSAISADSLEVTLANLERAAALESQAKSNSVPPPDASRGIVNARVDAPVTVDVASVELPEPKRGVSDTNAVAWERGASPLETPRQLLETNESDDSSTGSGWSLARAIKKQAKQAATKKEGRKARAKDAKSKGPQKANRANAKSEPDGSKDVVDYEAAAFPFGRAHTAGAVEERHDEISEPPTLLRLNTSLEESFGEDFAPAAVDVGPQASSSPATETDLLDVEKTESHLSPMSEFLAERVHNTQANQNVFEEESNEVGSNRISQTNVELPSAVDPEPQSDVPLADDRLDEVEVVSKPLKVDVNDRALDLDCLETADDTEPKISTSSTLRTEDTSPLSNVDDMTPSSDAFSQFEFETKEAPLAGSKEVATPDSVSRSVLTDEATPHQHRPSEVEGASDASALDTTASTAAAFLRIAERMKNRSLSSKQLSTDYGTDSHMRSLPQVDSEKCTPPDVGEANKPETCAAASLQNDSVEAEIAEAPSEELEDELCTSAAEAEIAEAPSEELEDDVESPSTSIEEQSRDVPIDNSNGQPCSEPVVDEPDVVVAETFESCQETLGEEINTTREVPGQISGSMVYSDEPNDQCVEKELDDGDCSSTDDLLNNLDTMVRDLDGMANSRRNETVTNDDYSVATAPSFTDAVKVEQSSSSSRDVESEMVVECEETRVGQGFAGMPFMISEINNEAGIPKGDIMVSLLNTDGVASQTWSSRVSEAIWRCRMMRRHCDLEWMELFAMRKKGRRKMKASLLVDVDEGRVFGGLEELPKIHEAATENLCNDEFDDALDLYEDALMIYENYGDGIKDDETKSRKFKQYEIACLNNVGMVHLLRGEFEEALPYFQNACESVAGFSEPDQAVSYTSHRKARNSNFWYP